jgi:hypothetical protein
VEGVLDITQAAAAIGFGSLLISDMQPVSDFGLFAAVGMMLSGPPDAHNGRLSCTDCHDLSTPRQRQEEFATRCATCHNSRYGTLFYSWATALDQNSASIKQNLKRIDDPNDARRLQLEQILEDAAAG